MITITILFDLFIFVHNGRQIIEFKIDSNECVWERNVNRVLSKKILLKIIIIINFKLF
jgi:hypothetical protein